MSYVPPHLRNPSSTTVATARTPSVTLDNHHHHHHKLAFASNTTTNCSPSLSSFHNNASRRSSAAPPSPRILANPDTIFPQWQPSERVSRMTPEQIEEVRSRLNLDVAVASDSPPAPAPIESFTDMCLHPSIMKDIAYHEYTRPTSIQAQAMPIALSGRDLLGCAETGSGKTAAFTIPMIQHCLAQHPIRRNDGPLALVLAPTRELAQQIEKEVKAFSRSLESLKTAIVVGGTNIEKQRSELRAGVEIAVATPGRFIDHLQQGNTSLSRISFVVLDEADRMLDMGFEPQIREVMRNLPEKHQTLLFSATMPVEIEELSKEYLANPVQVKVGKVSSPTTNVSQTLVKISENEKNGTIPFCTLSLSIAGHHHQRHRPLPHLSPMILKSGLEHPTNHGMTSHIAKAAVEELKKFLIHDSVDEMKRRLDKLFMVVILRTLHSDFDHVLDQILAGEQVPSMDSLVTRLLCVPTLVRGENSVVATETSVAPVETSAMVASRGRGSRGNRGGRSSRGGRPQCTYCKKLGHTQEKCYVLHGYPNNVAHVSKSEKSESKFSDEKYQDYLRLKSISQAQASSWPSVSIACISQYVEGGCILVHIDRLLDLLVEEASQAEKCGHPCPLTIVFVERKTRCDEVAEALVAQGLSAVSLHGGRSQSEREAALHDFRSGSTNILVATDVASRGLDVTGVSHVINLDLPKTMEDYVHRIGRTGRAGSTGLATSFYTDRDMFLVANIRKAIADAESGNTLTFATGKVARRKEKEAAAAQKEANIALSKQLGLGAASMNIEDKYKFMITATNTKKEGAADSAWDD
ncbi:putative ATP-dependent RNA helicase DDX46 [Glycine soja]